MATAGLPAGTDPQNARGALTYGAMGTPLMASGPSGGGVTPAELVRRSNFWRDNYNPLRGLKMVWLTAVMEQAERGAFSEIQLTLRKAEKRYPVLKGFIERMLSSVEELDWDVKPLKVLPDGATPALVEAQRKFLRARYDLIENLNDAIGQITLADIRGYAILQKHRFVGGDNDGAVRELYWLEPWCFVRDGFYGDFYYNENSQFGVGLGSCQETLGEKNRIGSAMLPREEFVIREVNAPLYEIALIAFVNWLMGRKDYAAFVEIFGLAKGVVIMPPNIAIGKEQDYQAAAAQVSDGVAGALPAGSDIKFPTAGVRGESPFEKYCESQDKDFVMAATSGILSMLSEGGGGLNRGPHKEHGDAWERIAKMKGKRANEVLRRDFDRLELAAEFPGQPICVQFTLAVQDDEDVNTVADTVVKLEGVGLQTDEKEISERTGYKLKRVPLPGAGDGGGDPAQKQDQSLVKKDTRIANRAPGVSDDFTAALSADLQLLRDRVAAIEAISDPGLRARKFQALLEEWDQLVTDSTADPEIAKVLKPAPQS